MVNLQELPTELLSQIFSDFLWDNRLLRDLALQCRCFRLIVRPILLANVILETEGRFVSRRTGLLNRSIAEMPELASMVRTVFVRWSERSPEVHSTIESLLGRLTALRVLMIQKLNDHSSFTHDFLEVNGLDHLEEVRLTNPTLIINEMAKYTFLRKVQRLSVVWLRNPIPPTFDIRRLHEYTFKLKEYGNSGGKSPIVDLNLGVISHLPEPVLKEVLSWPRALKKLRSTIPGHDYPGRWEASKSLLSTFSPEGISRALSPLKETLEDLELMDDNCVWTGHDETKMDLRDFKVLSKIYVPSTCFFKDLTYGVKREGLYKLLPQTLVELRILYDLKDCIRPNLEERGPLLVQSLSLDDFIDLELMNFGAPKDLKWLMEFAENKKECFPDLRRVQLIERCGAIRSGVYPINWDLPPMIADEFCREGIEFRAVMRMNSPGPTFD